MRLQFRHRLYKQFLKSSWNFLGLSGLELGADGSLVTLTQGTEEDIRKSTREAIAALAPGGGFVLSPIGGIWSGIPWRSVEVMSDEWEKWGRYPMA